MKIIKFILPPVHKKKKLVPLLAKLCFKRCSKNVKCRKIKKKEGKNHPFGGTKIMQEQGKK